MQTTRSRMMLSCILVLLLVCFTIQQQQEQTTTTSVEWVKQYVKNSNHDEHNHHRVVIDSQGNIIIVGSFTNTIQFPTSSSTTIEYSSQGMEDAFVASFNPSGDVVNWVKIIGGNESDCVNDVQVDSLNDDSIFIAGYVSGNIEDIDGLPIVTYGALDSFVAKLNRLGTVQWVKSGGGTMNDYAVSLTLSADGNHVNVVGYFQSPLIELDTTTTITNVNVDLIVVQYSSSDGQMEHFISVNDTSSSSNEIYVTRYDQMVVVVGKYNSEIIIDGYNLTTTTATTTDVFIWMLHATNLTTISVKSVGFVADDFTMNDVTIMAEQGLLLIVGSFSGEYLKFHNNPSMNLFSTSSNGGGGYICQYSLVTTSLVSAKSIDGTELNGGGSVVDCTSVTYHNTDKMICMSCDYSNRTTTTTTTTDVLLLCYNDQLTQVLSQQYYGGSSSSSDIYNNTCSDLQFSDSGVNESYMIMIGRFNNGSTLGLALHSTSDHNNDSLVVVMAKIVFEKNDQTISSSFPVEQSLSSIGHQVSSTTTTTATTNTGVERSSQESTTISREVSSDFPQLQSSSSPLPPLLSSTSAGQSEQQQTSDSNNEPQQESTVVVIPSENSQSDSSSEFEIELLYQPYYPACGDVPTIQAHVYDSTKQDITMASDFSWTAIGLMNQNYNRTELIYQSATNTNDSSSLLLSHDIFPRGRQFDITVQVSGIDTVTYSKSITIEIGDFLVNVSVSKPSTTVYRRSDTITLQARTVGDLCGPTVSGTWTVVPSVQNVPPVLYGNSVQLSLLSFPLIDSNYTFYYQAALNFSYNDIYQHRIINGNQTIIYSDTNAFNIQLIILSPRAIISGTTGLTASVGDILPFDGSESHDNENTLGVAPTYLWTCSPSTSCDIITAPNPSSIFVKFNSVGTYSVTLMYVVGSRSGSTSVSVLVFPKDTAIPIVSIVSAPRSVVSKSSKISVSATVYPPNYSQIDFRWTLTKVMDGSRIDLTGVLLLSPDSISRNLVLRENVLESGTQYTLTIYAKYKSQQNFLASSSVEFRTSSAPFGGSFNVYPTVGYALSTVFQLDVTGWSDDLDALPLTYSFEYDHSQQVPTTTTTTTTTNARRTTTSISSTTIPLLTADGSFADIQTILPPGDYDLYLKVRNRYGDETLQKVSLMVEPLSALNTSVVLNTTVSQLLMLNQEQLELHKVLNQLPTLVASLRYINYFDHYYSSTLVSDLLNVLTRVVLANNNRLTTSQVGQITTSIETISTTSTTTSTTIISRSQSTMVYNILKSILTASSISTDIISTKSMTAITNTLSNIYNPLSFSSQEQSTQMNELLSSVAFYCFRFLSPAEQAIQLTSTNIEMYLYSNYAANLQNTRVPIIAPIVTIPTVRVLESVEQQLYVYFVKYLNGLNPHGWSTTSKNITTEVIDFKIMRTNESQFATFPLKDLENGIDLRFYRNASQVLPDHSYYSCRSWDYSNRTITGWNEDGCTLVTTTDTSIVCRCTHTTSFAAFLLYDDSDLTGQLNNIGLYVFAIIYYSMIGVIACVILLFIVVNRRSEPIKSRHVVPYIGLIAIIVDCILQGVVKNSLLIRNSGTIDKSDGDGVVIQSLNILSYVILCIATPLSLMAISAYLWQVFRFLFMKRLMRLLIIVYQSSHHQDIHMDQKNDILKIKLLRMITSTYMYYGVISIVGLITCAYFVIWSILGGTNVLNVNTITIIQSVSYLVLEIIIALLIVLLFIWDFVIVQWSETQPQVSSNNNDKKKKKRNNYLTLFITQIVHHFSHSDLLYFRVEFLIMLLSIVALIVAFALGITENFSIIGSGMKYNSPVIVGRVVFDVLCIGLRLLVFGGFVSLVRIVRFRHRASPAIESLIQQHQQHQHQQHPICRVLNDDNGFKQFQQMCMGELSVESTFLWREITRILENYIQWSSTERWEQLNRIHTMYIQRNSLYQVVVEQLDRRTLKRWNKVIERKQVDEYEPGIKVLHMLRACLISSYTDLFTRFYTTNHHAIQQQQEQSELKENQHQFF